MAVADCVGNRPVSLDVPMTKPATKSDLIAELAGEVCRCGNRKKARQTFCGRCYYTLSKTQRSALYSPVGRGYAEAYGDALATLQNRGRVPK